MFCPNCGTQNEEAASPCKKCGFKLSGVSAPKFKGTMMLSSEQSVQQLVEEHRRKLEAEAATAAAATAAAAAQTPPAQTPPSNIDAALANSKPGLNTIRGGLQPARPGLPRPKPGGTVIGVAPQVGGFTPSTPRVASAAAPQMSAPEAAPAPSSGERRMEPAPEALAAAVPLVPEVESASIAAVAPEIAGANPRREPVLARQPAALGFGPTLESAAPPRLPEEGVAPPAPNGNSAAAPESLAQAAVETSEAASSPAPGSASVPTSTRAAPARVRALEVFLILITFGLYGLVLLFRQRREPS